MSGIDLKDWGYYTVVFVNVPAYINLESAYKLKPVCQQ